MEEWQVELEAVFTVDFKTLGMMIRSWSKRHSWTPLNKGWKTQMSDLQGHVGEELGAIPRQGRVVERDARVLDIDLVHLYNSNYKYTEMWTVYFNSNRLKRASFKSLTRLCWRIMLQLTTLFLLNLFLSYHTLRLGGFESSTMHSYTITGAQIRSRRQRSSVSTKARIWLSSELFFGT
jgi:hypothetical protein